MTTSHPLGAPCWIDLSTSEIGRAQQFYGAVFGWTFESAGPEYGGYVSAFVDGVQVAGLMPNDPQWNMPDRWNTYLHTADADATIEAITAAGGFSCGGAMDIPAKGRMAMVCDPTGGMIGLWQPTEHLGFEATGVAGAPVWHQLTTRDFAETLDFYRAVFGWQAQVEADSDEFRYSTVVFDGEQRIGVMDGGAFMAADEPSNWFFFLGAEDVDKAQQLIVDNGGSITRPAEDTPYGRLASVADPTGAGFSLSSLQP
ncbi:VOC family protein [Mycobacterium sp. ITM-2016-00316]|uniref:VOC family protein n=1 Tax=Mycobacterium sp. ITM-2016-00316 TaxID=2099695 RepID=UPI000CF92F54|nr:VOC family protein [Mycobacterium sp. ITM-2016-00316]WNG81170.1 VOC family protein [Mycobacterium sp. ITM-2016-00316]